MIFALYWPRNWAKNAVLGRFACPETGLLSRYLPERSVGDPAADTRLLGLVASSWPMPARNCPRHAPGMRPHCARIGYWKRALLSAHGNGLSVTSRVTVAWARVDSPEQKRIKTQWVLSGFREGFPEGYLQRFANGSATVRLPDPSGSRTRPAPGPVRVLSACQADAMALRYRRDSTVLAPCREVTLGGR